MSQYIWLVEHREWSGDVMECTILHAATTLQIAEHLLRFGYGAKSTDCWYAIYPEALDHPLMGDKIGRPPEVMRDEGHFVLNFYDAEFNQIEEQPQQP